MEARKEDSAGVEGQARRKLREAIADKVYEFDATAWR